MHRWVSSKSFTELMYEIDNCLGINNELHLRTKTVHKKAAEHVQINSLRSDIRSIRVTWSNPLQINHLKIPTITSLRPSRVNWSKELNLIKHLIPLRQSLTIQRRPMPQHLDQVLRRRLRDNRREHLNHQIVLVEK